MEFLIKCPTCIHRLEIYCVKECGVDDKLYEPIPKEVHPIIKKVKNCNGCIHIWEKCTDCKNYNLFKSIHDKEVQPVGNSDSTEPWKEEGDNLTIEDEAEKFSSFKEFRNCFVEGAKSESSRRYWLKDLSKMMKDQMQIHFSPEFLEQQYKLYKDNS